jgi:hypothetical protein
VEGDSSLSKEGEPALSKEGEPAPAVEGDSSPSKEGEPAPSKEGEPAALTNGEAFSQALSKEGENDAKVSGPSTPSSSRSDDPPRKKVLKKGSKPSTPSSTRLAGGRRPASRAGKPDESMKKESKKSGAGKGAGKKVTEAGAKRKESFGSAEVSTGSVSIEAGAKQDSAESAVSNEIILGDSATHATDVAEEAQAAGRGASADDASPRADAPAHATVGESVVQGEGTHQKEQVANQPTPPLPPPHPAVPAAVPAPAPAPVTLHPDGKAGGEDDDGGSKEAEGGKQRLTVFVEEPHQLATQGSEESHRSSGEGAQDHDRVISREEALEEAQRIILMKAQTVISPSVCSSSKTPASLPPLHEAAPHDSTGYEPNQQVADDENVDSGEPCIAAESGEQEIESFVEFANLNQGGEDDDADGEVGGDDDVEDGWSSAPSIPRRNVSFDQGPVEGQNVMPHTPKVEVAVDEERPRTSMSMGARGITTPSSNRGARDRFLSSPSNSQVMSVGSASGAGARPTTGDLLAPFSPLVKDGKKGVGGATRKWRLGEQHAQTSPDVLSLGDWGERPVTGVSSKSVDKVKVPHESLFDLNEREFEGAFADFREQEMTLFDDKALPIADRIQAAAELMDSITEEDGKLYLIKCVLIDREKQLEKRVEILRKKHMKTEKELVEKGKSSKIVIAGLEAEVKEAKSNIKKLQTMLGPEFSMFNAIEKLETSVDRKEVKLTKRQELLLFRSVLLQKRTERVDAREAKVQAEVDRLETIERYALHALPLPSRSRSGRSSSKP